MSKFQKIVDKLVAEDVKRGKTFPISRYPDWDAMDIDVGEGSAKWALIRPPVGWYTSESKKESATDRLGLFIVGLEEDEQQRMLGLVEAAWRSEGLLAFTFKYPLVALGHGELIDGWHRLALWTAAFGSWKEPSGPWTLVKVN